MAFTGLSVFGGKKWEKPPFGARTHIIQGHFPVGSYDHFTIFSSLFTKILRIISTPTLIT